MIEGGMIGGRVLAVDEPQLGQDKVMIDDNITRMEIEERKTDSDSSDKEDNGNDLLNNKRKSDYKAGTAKEEGKCKIYNS
jgi:hypothetical protein